MERLLIIFATLNDAWSLQLGRSADFFIPGSLKTTRPSMYPCTATKYKFKMTEVARYICIISNIR